MKIISALLLACILTLPAMAAPDFEETKRFAEAGESWAQYSLGVKYAAGDGVPVNASEAVNWYRLAAEQGYATAQYNLGTSYAKGDGVLANNAKAVKWYRLAAEQGYTTAQFTLGFNYIKGKGVPKNYIRAYKVWAAASDQGHHDAEINLAKLTKILTPAERVAGQQLATECHERNNKDCGF